MLHKTMTSAWSMLISGLIGIAITSPPSNISSAPGKMRTERRRSGCSTITGLAGGVCLLGGVWDLYANRGGTILGCEQIPVGDITYVGGREGPCGCDDTYQRIRVARAHAEGRQSRSHPPRDAEPRSAVRMVDSVSAAGGWEGRASARGRVEAGRAHDRMGVWVCSPSGVLLQRSGSTTASDTGLFREWSVLVPTCMDATGDQQWRHHWWGDRGWHHGKGCSEDVW